MVGRLKEEIKLLPEHIINQIKAGEVVESPASLMKELIENSLDANATKIEISISQELTEHLSVKDNGKGISKENLPLAFARHATSKIENFSDIYSIYSFGFRGEALASIASVSNIHCRTTQNKKTSTVEIKAGVFSSIDECDSNEENGTELHIKNLFFNTPARLKFIKSRNAEKNKIQKIIDAFIISNPHVTFIIDFGENEKKIYPAISGNNSLSDRVLQYMNIKRSTNEDNFFQAQFEYKEHLIKFFASKIGTKTNANRKQFLIANKRYFTDKKIHHLILRKMAEQFWQFGHTGDYVCMIDVPCNLIDPNVHPSKTELKFIHHEYLYSGLNSIIKNESIKKSEIINNISPQQNNIPSTKAEFKIEDTYFFNNFVSPSSETQYHQMFNDFFYKQKDDSEIQLYYSKEIFVQFILQELNRYIPNEKNQTTLLLGISISKKEIEHFDYLERLGIFIEDLDENQFIIKDIPNFLNYFNSKIIKEILLILSKNENNLTDSLSKLWDKIFPQLNHQTIIKINEILSNQSYVKTIHKNEIAPLFFTET